MWVNSLAVKQLLRDYSRIGSEKSFAEFVRRHVDFAYNEALRMVRETQLAEDMTQEVLSP
jgi:DNA-directed RNA polymerase specialized sigma24 family protein